MVRFIIRRILSVIPVMFGVIVIVFVLRTVTPGDPVDQIAPTNSFTEEQREEVREELGLNKPMPVQFLNYVVGVVTGDLGESYITREPVLESMLRRLPVSLTICLGAVAIGLVIGVPLGVISAIKQYTWVDSSLLFLSILAASTPGFVLGLCLITVFAVNLHWLPAVGIASPLGYIMPMFTIAVVTLSQFTRIIRSSMLEVIRQDYIYTARAKGQTERVITTRHALRNALIPVAAAAGNQINIQLGGGFIVEAVFGIPGIGKFMADSIAVRDFPVIQGGVIVLAFMFTIINLLIDLCFVAIDPRLKTSIFDGPRKKRWKLRPKRISQGMD